MRAVATAFNSMARRLDEVLASQRAFVADASHQLRTPLTALRLRLENLEPDVTGDAAAELAAAIDETERLGRLVEGLLVLARTDERAADPVPVDAVAVLRTRTDTWRPVVEDRGVRLRLETHPVPTVRAVPGTLEQVIDNLVANAVDVAPPGSDIVLRVVHVGDAVEVHVTDAGPGMSHDQRRQAFDRFWRARGSGHGGFGLGLAIVQRLVTAGGATVELRDVLGGGLDAVVVLPVTPSGGTAGTDRRVADRSE